MRAPSTVSVRVALRAEYDALSRRYPAFARRRYHRSPATSGGRPSRHGSTTHQPTLIAATKVTTAVTTAIVHSGSAQRTDQPSWSTSRLVRVSRSPEPADSTVPTGSASALPTKSSRSRASTCSPSAWLRYRAYLVSTVCRTRKPAR